VGNLLDTTVKNTDIAVRDRNYHTAMGNHMPYGITQCYLPPGRGDFPTFYRLYSAQKWNGLLLLLLLCG